jgi:hypothetical protein
MNTNAATQSVHGSTLIENTVYHINVNIVIVEVCSSTLLRDAVDKVAP